MAGGTLSSIKAPQWQKRKQIGWERVVATTTAKLHGIKAWPLQVRLGLTGAFDRQAPCLVGLQFNS